MTVSKNKIIFIASVIFLASGCSTPTYRQVFRQKQNFNSGEFLVSKDDLYHAAIKALCANNFIIDKEDPENGFVLGKRSFQKGNKTIVLLVQGKIIPENESKSVIFLNAMETTEVSYVTDRTRFFLFIIPLPGGGGKEAHCIKQKEKTVQDKTFYRNFFKAIEREIPKLAESKSVRTDTPQ